MLPPVRGPRRGRETGQQGLPAQLRKLLSYNFPGQLGTNKHFVIIVVHLLKKEIQNQVFSKIVPMSGVVHRSGQICLMSSVSSQTPRGSAPAFFLETGLALSLHDDTD